jgi:two-component sensor histidine kinase
VLTSSGLGHQLIKGLIESQLGGDFCVRMGEQGIVCHLRVPLTDDAD